MTTTPAPTIEIQHLGASTVAVHTRSRRPLAVEWPPAGLAIDWVVSNLDGERIHYDTAEDARAALLTVATATAAQLPPCGQTHDEHMVSWRSWRDDCIDPVAGCGFGMQDVDQCERGHPDDGCDWCGACGYERPST